ncbi:MAG: hypothetical protein ABSD59_11185 [Terracidiphilus sp.]
MREEAPDSYIRQYIEAHDTPVATFAWQGGEPTPLGVEFFRRVVENEKRYANGRQIANAFQTNGVLLKALGKDGFIGASALLQRKQANRPRSCV